MPQFSLEQRSGFDDVFDVMLVVVPAKRATPKALAAAIRQWTAVLALKGKAAILRHPLFEERDPWFGFGVRVGKKLLSERQVFAALKKGPLEPVEAFVDALIAFNRKNAETLEGGLATHEELETGSAAVEWLVQRDLGQLNRYLRFLASLDLAHTVEQVSVVARLAKTYSQAELAPLTKWVATHDAQLLNDWLADGRLWKKT